MGQQGWNSGGPWQRPAQQQPGRPLPQQPHAQQPPPGGPQFGGPRRPAPAGHHTWGQTQWGGHSNRGGQPGWGAQQAPRPGTWGPPPGQTPWGSPQQFPTPQQQPYPAGARPYVSGTVTQYGRPLGQRPPTSGGGGSKVVVGCLAVAMVMAVVVVGCSAAMTSLSSSTTTTRPRVTATYSRTTPRPTQPPTTATRPPTTAPTTPPPTNKVPPPPKVPSGSPVPPGVKWEALPKPHSTHPGWVKTQQNPFNAFPIPAASCPAVPKSIGSGTAFQKLARALLECEYQRWRPMFAAQNRAYARPKVVFYNGSTQSACGSVKGYEVSFYCAAGTPTIFVHNGLLKESNQWWHLRVAETMAHEFFHHVQYSSGLFEGRNLLRQEGIDSLELARRTELQTACVSSRILLVTPSFRFTRTDYNVMRKWFAGGQDAKHGNARSNTYWGTRGFYMDRVGGCNTWLVGSASVA
ncbi:neutral zinc metallopeptidase [Aestuariimicrobium soli]|uniref:neutral zinc metallopeptidase n=1 Tax=Aestuariimicrobium soli TaxID=2035834 RepID=UPI003EBD8C67